MGKYCQHVLIAFPASANRPEVICQFFFFFFGKWHLILPDVAWAVSIYCEPHLLWECWLYDSSFFDNRFCDFLFYTNLAEKQSASGETSSCGYLPHFRKLSVFEFAATLQGGNIKYFYLSWASITFPVCTCVWASVYVLVCVGNCWDALKSVLLIGLLCCSCCSQQPSCPHCLWWVMGNAQNATSVRWLSWFFIHGKSRLAVWRKVCYAPRNNILGCWWCWGRDSLGCNDRLKKKYPPKEVPSLCRNKSV